MAYAEQITGCHVHSYKVPPPSPPSASWMSYGKSWTLNHDNGSSLFIFFLMETLWVNSHKIGKWNFSRKNVRYWRHAQVTLPTLPRIFIVVVQSICYYYCHYLKWVVWKCGVLRKRLIWPHNLHPNPGSHPNYQAHYLCLGKPGKMTHCQHRRRHTFFRRGWVNACEIIVCVLSVFYSFLLIHSNFRERFRLFLISPSRRKPFDLPWI